MLYMIFPYPGFSIDSSSNPPFGARSAVRCMRCNAGYIHYIHTQSFFFSTCT